MDKTNLTKLSKNDLAGKHNQDIDGSISRLKRLNSYKELSTICIIPNNGVISAKVAENWLNQTSQMNQKFVRLMMIGLEKYHAFNNCIENILLTPKLSEFKYILTLEEDTIIPADGLHKLFESMDKYDVVGGLAFTKGIEGKPMVYGNPTGFFETMTKTSVYPETIQPCRGIGTSYTMFKLDIFKNEKLKKPWFRSDPRLKLGESNNEEIDSTFFDDLYKLGYKVACDTRVRLGKYDIATDTIW